jgi:PhnB protein
MHLNPYLSYKGDCAAAFKFYETAIGGKINFVMTYGEAPPGSPVPPDMKDKIMHASMTIGETELMGADAPVQFASTPAGFSVSINVKTPEEAEKIFAALSDGGSVKVPIGETFWAQRFAMLIDKFSIPWMINCEKPMG